MSKIQIRAERRPHVLSHLCFLSGFFFQAEAGIRDLTVTGVQTCALPICQQLRAIQSELGEADPGEREASEMARKIEDLNLPEKAATEARREIERMKMLSPASSRSEERREGKSVDLGGRRIIKKKKQRRRA